MSKNPELPWRKLVRLSEETGLSYSIQCARPGPRWSITCGDWYSDPQEGKYTTVVKQAIAYMESVT